MKIISRRCTQDKMYPRHAQIVFLGMLAPFLVLRQRDTPSHFPHSVFASFGCVTTGAKYAFGSFVSTMNFESRMNTASIPSFSVFFFFKYSVWPSFKPSIIHGKEPSRVIEEEGWGSACCSWCTVEVPAYCLFSARNLAWSNHGICLERV